MDKHSRRRRRSSNALCVYILIGLKRAHDPMLSSFFRAVFFPFDFILVAPVHRHTTGSTAEQSCVCDIFRRREIRLIRNRQSL